MDEFITVVFKCGKDSEVRKNVLSAFSNSEQYGDAEITAVSLEDEISRVEFKLDESLKAKPVQVKIGDGSVDGVIAVTDENVISAIHRATEQGSK